MAKRKEESDDLLSEVEEVHVESVESAEPVEPIESVEPTDPPDRAAGSAPAQAAMGPGGRPQVLTDADAGPRTPRNTDEVLPRCPNCSTEKVAVLCVVASKPGAIRYHYCPNRCGFLVKQMVPQVSQAMMQQRVHHHPDSEGSRRPKEPRPFVERPMQ